jgi:hypothetical protein
VTWISKTQFVTANEGDLNGGSRSFTVFNTDGSVAYDAGNSLEHLMARIGHTNDKRSDAKGNEPENAEFGRFDGTDYLFVASERSSALVVYDLSKANAPAYKQVLPAGLAPEGVLAIPSRNLLIAASESDDRSILSRSSLSIYQYQTATAAYPTIQSVNRADGTPIPWAPCRAWQRLPPAHWSMPWMTASLAPTGCLRLTPPAHLPSCKKKSASPTPTARLPRWRPRCPMRPVQMLLTMPI